MACSRKKILDHVSVRKLKFNSNSANVETLMNNSGITINVKLLSIEESIEPDHAFPCIYDSHKDDFSICNITYEKFPHLYISTNIENKHYMIILSRKVTLTTKNIKILVDKLYNSIMRFKAEEPTFPNIAIYKPLRYCIFFYGDSSYLATSNLDNFDSMISTQLARKLRCDRNDIKIKSEIISKTNYLTIRKEDDILRFKFTAINDAEVS
jgi:hypothetical protein